MSNFVLGNAFRIDLLDMIPNIYLPAWVGLIQYDFTPQSTDLMSAYHLATPFNFWLPVVRSGGAFINMKGEGEGPRVAQHFNNLTFTDATVYGYVLTDFPQIQFYGARRFPLAPYTVHGGQVFTLTLDFFDQLFTP